MSVQGIETQTSYYETVQYAGNAKKDSTKKDAAVSDKQDVFVKSDVEAEKKDSTKQIYKKNTAVIERLKQDAENRRQQLKALVEKSLSKQGTAYHTLSELFSAIKDGKVTVEPAAIAQAKKDVAEDGYWGVEQTSDRFVEFAKALTGGDPSKADEMIKAMEKGFEQAEKAWGGKLPDICSQTIAAAKEKMNQWKAELEKESNSF